MSDTEDAARYRWLKQTGRLGQWRVQRWEVEAGEWNPDRGRGTFETVPGDKLDNAIDDAMRADNASSAPVCQCWNPPITIDPACPIHVGTAVNGS